MRSLNNNQCRRHPRTRYPQGQGLGLYIALEVMRRHGFSIEFGRSEYGGLLVTLSGDLKGEGAQG